MPEPRLVSDRTKLPASDCPASMEAVQEHEMRHGDAGCPICERDALDHRLEDQDALDEREESR